MIEDALRNSRNLHRLILAVNLAGVVLAMTITNPVHEKLLVQGLGELRSIDFLDYDDFTDTRVRAALDGYFVRQIRSLEAQLDSRRQPTAVDQRLLSQSYPARIDELSFALRESIEPTRYRVKGSRLEHVGLMTLDEIARIFRSEETKKGVRVTIPNMYELKREILAAAARSPYPRTQIKEWSITPGPVEPAPDGHEPNPGNTVVVEFVLRPAPDLPLILLDVPTKGKSRATVGLMVETVGESSFRAWYNNVAKAARWDFQSQPPWVYSHDDIVTVPLEMLDLPLVEALESARRSLQEQSPENKHLNLLGTEIPGRLAVLAVPLASLTLVLYLLGSVIHLTHLANDHRKEMSEFSWLPLSLRTGSTWRFEVVATMIVLPFLSNLLLILRLRLFGVRGLTSTAVSVCAGLTALAVGLLVYDRFKELRSRLGM